MPISAATILAATLPVFAIIALGFWFRRRGWLQAGADRSILFLTINVTYPALILHKILGDEALHNPDNIWQPAACGAGLMALGIAVAWLAAPLFGLTESKTRRTFALACSVQNYGYLPIPIMAALFPQGSWGGVLFVYSLGIELVLWTLGVLLLTGHVGGAARQVFNPVVFSILLGVTLNLAKIDHHVPSFASDVLLRLGECAIPLGLLMVGVTLADLVQGSAIAKDWRAPIGGVILRLGLLPATMVTVAWWVAPTLEFRHVLAVQAAMPAAVFPMILARRYGGDEATAVRVIVFTTLASIATIPVVLKLALQLLG